MAANSQRKSSNVIIVPPGSDLRPARGQPPRSIPELSEWELLIIARFGESFNFRIMSLLKFGRPLLSGERIHADEGLLKIMFAPVRDELRPTAPLRPAYRYKSCSPEQRMLNNAR